MHDFNGETAYGPEMPRHRSTIREGREEFTGLLSLAVYAFGSSETVRLWESSRCITYRVLVNDIQRLPCYCWLESVASLKLICYCNLNFLFHAVLGMLVCPTFRGMSSVQIWNSFSPYEHSISGACSLPNVRVLQACQYRLCL